MEDLNLTTIPNDNLAQKNIIELYAQCNTCLNDRPQGMPPRDWGILDVGLTKDGMHIQLWCRRCELNVGIFTLTDVIEAGCDSCCEH